MKQYSVNVHYDYYVSIDVLAESESEAIDLAKGIADDSPMINLEYCDYIDSCITDEKEAEQQHKQ